MKIISVIYDICISFMKNVEEYLPIGSLPIHCPSNRLSTTAF
jgi:hypothetical protein